MFSLVLSGIMITNEKQTDTGKSNFIVAENTCYHLSYDLPKNRVYFSILGFWKNREAVPNFLKDWRRAMALTMPGFTVQSDLSLMLTQPQELNEIHLEAQRIMREAGVLLVAQVLPQDRIATLQVEQLYHQSKIPLQKFATVQAAEAALSKLVISNQ